MWSSKQMIMRLAKKLGKKFFDRVNHDKLMATIASPVVVGRSRSTVVPVSWASAERITNRKLEIRKSKVPFVDTSSRDGAH
jgi:hypothetical protein